MRKNAIINVVGHDLISPGAVGQGIPERYLLGAWVPIYVRAQRAAGLRAGVDYRRVEDGDYDARYSALVARCIERKPRIVLDYHFNSGGYPGVLCIHSPGSEAGRELAATISAAVSAAHGTRDLGARDNAGIDGRPRAWGASDVVDGRYYPAGPVLRLLELPPPTIAVVIELFDGSVEADHHAATASMRAGRSQAALARVLADHIAR